MNTYKVIEEFKGEKVEGQEPEVFAVGMTVEMEEAQAAVLVEKGLIELVSDSGAVSTPSLNEEAGEEKKEEESVEGNVKPTTEEEKSVGSPVA